MGSKIKIRGEKLSWKTFDARYQKKNPRYTKTNFDMRFEIIGLYNRDLAILYIYEFQEK